MNENREADRLISMRNAMIITYIVLTIVAVSVLVSVLLFSKERAMLKQSESYCAVAAAQSSRNVENFCNNIEEASCIVFMGEEFSSFYPKNTEYTASEQGTIDRLNDLFAMAGYMYDYGDFGIIYSNNSTVGLVSDGTLDLFGEQCYSKAVQLLGEKQQTWNMFYSENVSRICFLKKVNEHAVFIASVYSTQFSRVFSKLSTGSTLSLYVADENNKIIYATESSGSFYGDDLPFNISEKLAGRKDVTIGDESGVYTAIELYNGWKLLAVVNPPNEGIPDNGFSTETIIAIIGISTLTVFVLAGFIIGSFYSSKRRVPRVNEEMYDPVTGVLNPYYCEEKISDLIEISLVGGTWAYALVKIADYELISQRLGSDFAGESMKKTAEIIQEHFGDSAAVGLNIEHDFVVFCDFSDFDIFKAHNDLRAKFMELRKKLDNVLVGENEDYRLEIDLGVCIYPDHGKSFDELEFKAKAALAKAAQENGDGICFYEEKKMGGGKK